VKVKTPKEDPTIKSAREREERRADASFVENTSGLLDDETRKRIRRFGQRGGAVKAPGGGATGGGSGGGAGGSSGGGSFDPGVGGGGGFNGGNSGGNQSQQVY